MNTALKIFKKQAFYQILVLFGVLYLFIFNYIPMFGLIIAFKDYSPTQGVIGFFTSDWVGLKWIKEFYNEIYFWRIIRNTVIVSVLNLVFMFPIPIFFAILLNELKSAKFKKIVQTVSYLPHFISWVVVSGLIFVFLNVQNGLVNDFLVWSGITKDPVSFISDPKYYWWMVILSNIWKSMGWGAIIFLAAIAGIDQTLYEAAVMDGASRIQRIIYVTLPSIKSTIVIILILSLGSLFNGNFEQALLLGNSVNNSVSEILDTFTLKMGLAQGRFSYATAIGLFQSIISVALIYSSNYVVKRLTGMGLL
ncbi:ABC transporter permease [Cohnella zeiphila]|uniref:Sugar ABC transporter permease n=1 Tax=Cohnella zeiphila TaxID=2761120 RepID=A0A7X0SIZ8_9BACL|nr:ABC transporter permease subunit [Cohnella zeiphila]MBB6730865.1 sugar ABC transporter permease [Cohnella zeiphila]